MTGLAKVELYTSTFLVPEPRAVQMIEQCANLIFKASTIKDVRKVMTHAEAIAAVVRKIEASERVKRDGEFLLVMAERQLGEVSSSIPKRTGGRGRSQKHDYTIPPKYEVLEEAGFNINRALKAEALARTPIREVKAAFNRVLPTKLGNKSVNAVMLELGIKHSTPWMPRELLLAEDAIELLNKCCRARRAPTREEVTELENRLRPLQVSKK